MKPAPPIRPPNAHAWPRSASSEAAWVIKTSSTEHHPSGSLVDPDPTGAPGQALVTRPRSRRTAALCSPPNQGRVKRPSVPGESDEPSSAQNRRLRYNPGYATPIGAPCTLITDGAMDSARPLGPHSRDAARRMPVGIGSAACNQRGQVVAHRHTRHAAADRGRPVHNPRRPGSPPRAASPRGSWRSTPRRLVPAPPWRSWIPPLAPRGGSTRSSAGGTPPRRRRP